MEKIADLILGMAFGTIFVTFTLSGESIGQCHWIGVAMAIGLVLTITKWNKEEIDSLKKEIKELKSKSNDRIN